jgi:hypothetical protein
MGEGTKKDRKYIRSKEKRGKRQKDGNGKKIQNKSNRKE